MTRKVKVRVSTGSGFTDFLTLMFAIATAMIGHTIHGSLFWAIMDFLFFPLAWIKWLICQEVNASIIKQTFAFLLS